jgi:hypothetical protein
MSPIHPITFTLTNVLKIISFMSPFLFSLTIILYSILANKIVKGLVLLIGIVIVTFINYLLKNIIKSEQNPVASPFCNILPFPFTYRQNESVYDSPSLSSTILAFISSYLIFPMFTNNDVNYPIIIFALFFICINGAVEFMDRCSRSGGIVLGIIVGLILGIFYYNLIVISGHHDIAYFNQVISDNTQCSKPGPTKFRCTKYVRGDRDSTGNYRPVDPGESEQKPQQSKTGEDNSPPNKFNINPIYNDQETMPGNFYTITTTMTGNEGKIQATHISNLLKCGDPIEEVSYNLFQSLPGHNREISNNHYQFIVNCSGGDDEISREIRGDYSNSNNGYKDITGESEPLLDIRRLFRFTHPAGDKSDTHYYLIPGASDLSVCNALASTIGCNPCTSISGAAIDDTYKISNNLILYNNDADFGKDSAHVTKDPITAGWGLTYCHKLPTDTAIFKVYNDEVTISPHDNRIADWLDGKLVVKTGATKLFT